MDNTPISQENRQEPAAEREAHGMTTSPLQRFPQPRKPSLCFLLLTYDIEPEALARQSGLPLLTAVALTCGIGATEEIAQRALNGLNALKGTHYTLNDIAIDLHGRPHR